MRKAVMGMFKFSLIRVISLTMILVLSACGGNKKVNLESAEEIYKIGVNAYLWRASLDTMDFMPLLKADHSGGVILTDWQVNPRDTKERSKVDVFIVGPRLTAESLKISMHRQQLTGSGWREVSLRPGAIQQMTNAILMQARILRRGNARVID